MARVSVKKGAARLADVVDLVERGQEVELTRKGKVVAVLVPAARSGSPERRERAVDRAAALEARLQALRAQPHGRGRGMAPRRAESLVAQLHGRP